MYKNLAAALAAACFFAPVFSQTQTQAPATAATAAVVKAGFVYVSPITEAGWTRQHDEGRKAVEAALAERGGDDPVRHLVRGGRWQAAGAVAGDACESLSKGPVRPSR